MQKGLSLHSTVKRDGVLETIQASQLVPGDIVQLEEVYYQCLSFFYYKVMASDMRKGTIVPADGILVSLEAYLQVDQSAITGESLAVEKHTHEIMYQSSTVKRGEALMVVTHTGDKTYVGRSAALVNAASAGQGHFTEVLGGIGRRLLCLVALTLLMVWLSSFSRSLRTRGILSFTLAITIIGVPVGLPAVVTTTMAVGAAYLGKKKAVVQRLSAIESLAGVEILCTDK